MNGDEDIFADALSLPPAERLKFLDSACNGDDTQRVRIEALLRGYEGAQKILGAPLAARIVLEEKSGDVIGRYKLVHKIGEGGMGLVYLADQTTPVRRQVALKIIKLGMDTRAVVARFEAERQALALMDHPNIARVFDGGATDSGRPYFVMELVRGARITDYCDGASLSIPERLGLFVQVCHAIQHAHQKGIIHRDIKPSNILVTATDGVAVPKVIDFGIAKATEGRLTEETLATQVAAPVGTPAYMSPEQTVMTGLDIDTRSDIYSLGVLLYELLAGRTPFDSKELLAPGLDEMRKTIREKEPLRPTARLALLSEKELVATADRRSCEPARLRNELQRDLDWIVMKCLEKNRSRRYETASGLAADVRRHLNNEAVLARPPSAAYRLQKSVQRNRLAFAAAAAVALTLIAGSSFSTWSFLRERKALASETEQRIRADGEKLSAQRNLYAAHMNLAQQAWEEGNLDRLRQLLEETRAFSDRGFEWSYWQRQTHLPLMTLRGYLSHGANVWTVAFSPDGSRIVTGNGDHNGRVWDAASGNELFTLTSGSAFRSVAFSPNGQWIIAGLNDGTIKRWGAASGEEQLTFKGHGGRPITSVSFSPDSELIASASQDGTAKIWATSSGRERLTLRGHQGEVLSIAFSPDGKTIVTGGFDKLAMVWQAATGARILTLEGHVRYIKSVAVSPDSQRVVTGSGDRTAIIWNATTGQKLHVLKGHGEQVTSAIFSPDGRNVVTGSFDRTIKIWSAETGRELRTLKGHRDTIHAVSVSPDGRRIVSGSRDQTALVWDASRGSEPATLGDRRGRIASVAFSPDSARLVTGSSDNTASVWSAESGKELFRVTGHSAPILSAVFSPDNLRLFTASQDRTGRVWDAADGRALLPLNGHAAIVWCGAFSPDGKRIVTGGADRTGRVWDATSGRELFKLQGNSGTILSVTFSPDGQRIVTGGTDHSITAWSASDGSEKLKLKGHTATILSTAFSPDGRCIASASADASAKVWDSASGREMLTLKGHTGAIVSVAYAPDGGRIVTGSDDRTVRIWDAKGGQELLTLSVHGGSVRSVAFSPDGRLVAAGSEDGTATVWHAADMSHLAAWQKDEQAVALRKAALARVRPGLTPFSDAVTTAERYLAALENTSLTDGEFARLGRAADEGALKRWLVLAPVPWPVTQFENPNHSQGLDIEHIEGEAGIIPKAGDTTAWANGELTWHELNQEDFVIDFAATLGRVLERCAAYTVCYVRSEKPQSGLRLLVGTDAGAKIYLNGKPVYEYRFARPYDPDLDTVNDISLNAGLNVVMLKVVIEAGVRRWRDSIRFTDAAGHPVKGIAVTLDPSGVK